MASFADHLPRLRRYARALTGDRHAADDLVQDTLERGWAKFSLWRPGSRLDAWLLTIMHNLFVNQYRSRPPTAESLDELYVEPSMRASQADRLEVRDIDVALAQLPPEQREVLLLVTLEEYSYAETAQLLGVPIGTVMSRLARGREKLRALLDEGTGQARLRVVK
ncbi:MAG: RNA polymerase sigma factor [Betaproteobacteria bacterium]|jgi:RNA polymerase sigma-70 factor (ECF subfamily)|nr:RNA polymerase sigma factor [Betaproteobacteria bacterium]HMV21584.1 RNA polymerase sigma factor [Rhodocyclaceae bacterium]HMW78498.1 RNA polymerase sigma factor [Rhodocyclaceae bacterium]HNL21501.1 RNA polymerase sigma factor [Rhodocyclaceae bacterium]HNM21744.1 RNA polymerase sigma factor [Rhodocyclaceae bacterium]